VTDFDFVSRVLDGDEEALLALYRRYGSFVFSIAYRFLNSQQDAEEITQDVFMRVWKKSEQFDPERGKFTTWLAMITRHASIDRIRKRQRIAPDQGLISLDESPHLWEMLGNDGDNSELFNRLVSAMLNLSPEQQEAISLAYFQGMTQAEIAEYLGRPLGTVKSHIRQGMQRLREIWKSESV
jgi:RNA polymerase sigma-70 factor (ECF subfamily)